MAKRGLQYAGVLVSSTMLLLMLCGGFQSVCAGETVATGGTNARSSACVTILKSKLLNGDGCVNVLSPPVRTLVPRGGGFNESCNYYAVANILFASDGRSFTYVMQEKCFAPAGQETQKLTSYMKAKLKMDHDRHEQHVTGTLITYWWVATDLNGSRKSRPIRYISDANGVSEMPKMAEIYGVVQSRNKRTRLIMSAYTLDESETAWIVSLDTRTGSRVSHPIKACRAYGLSLHPKKPALVYSDPCSPARILSSTIDGDDAPIRRSQKTLVAFRPTSSDKSINITSPFFGAYSYARDGSCLYFVDDVVGRVLSFEPASRTTSVVAEIGNVNGSPYSVGEIATTSDGLNLFVTHFSGALYWIPLDSICGAARRVEVVANYAGGGLWGLSIAKDDKYMYVGTTDGRIFKLSINKSRLQ